MKNYIRSASFICSMLVLTFGALCLLTKVALLPTIVFGFLLPACKTN